MSTQDDPEVHIEAGRNSQNVLGMHTSNVCGCRARILDGRQLQAKRNDRPHTCTSMRDGTFAASIPYWRIGGKGIYLNFCPFATTPYATS